MNVHLHFQPMEARNLHPFQLSTIQCYTADYSQNIYLIELLSQLQSKSDWRSRSPATVLSDETHVWGWIRDLCYTIAVYATWYNCTGTSGSPTSHRQTTEHQRRHPFEMPSSPPLTTSQTIIPFSSCHPPSWTFRWDSAFCRLDCNNW